jgi:hypothetical protein
MSKFRLIINYFNTKTCNKIFTRAEYMAAIKLKNTFGTIPVKYADTIRCYLTRAGYLESKEFGLYRKIKKIPTDIPYTQLEREAYPNRKLKPSQELNY